MSSIATAIVATTAVSAYSSKTASRKAAHAQRDAAGEASDTELEMFYQGREDTAPWREAGENALAKLTAKIDAGPGKYTKSPGYAFRLAEGEKAIERSAAARSGVLSGRTAKALTRYGQDYATDDYDNFLARYYDSLKPLQSVAGVGQTTASQDAAQGNAVASRVGQNIIGAGDAEAGGYIDSANAVTGAANSGINNYLMWKYINK